jgi:hypothetical protein
MELTSKRKALGALALCQAGGVILVLALLGFAPPARGRILLLPLAPGSDAHIASLAIAGGARIVGTGPLHSLVVDGERAALWRPMLRAGVVLMAPPPVGCAPVEAVAA